MTKLTTSIIAVAVCVAFGVPVMAQTLPRDGYHAARKRVAAEYDMDKARCARLEGNARAVCLADARGQAKVARAEVEAQYHPSEQADRSLRVAKAEADYAVARERCGTQKGDAKSACVTRAKAALKHGMAHAQNG